MKRDEQALQRSIVQWLTLVVRPDVRWFHVPNGGGRSKVEGGILKGMGVMPGVPDLIFMWSETYPITDSRRDAKQPRVAFLEVKAGAGSLSPEQRTFRDWCVENGIPFEVVRSLEETQLVMHEWGITRESQRGTR